MTQRHTLGTLTYITQANEEMGGIYGPNSELIMPIERTVLGDANAQRIVDCVNNCEGINPKAVPELINMARKMVLIAEYKDRPTIANQGQAMDGFSELANYRNLLDGFKIALNKAEDISDERTERTL